MNEPMKTSREVEATLQAEEQKFLKDKTPLEVIRYRLHKASSKELQDAAIEGRLDVSVYRMWDDMAAEVQKMILEERERCVKLIEDNPCMSEENGRDADHDAIIRLIREGGQS